MSHGVYDDTLGEMVFTGDIYECYWFQQEYLYILYATGMDTQASEDVKLVNF